MTSAAGRHPTARTYWLVALVLAILTAIEITIPYTDIPSPWNAMLLVLFGSMKFLTVVGIFMHLRYDLTGYRFYFFFGLVGTLIVFMVVLATFHAL